ncbi:unnamed protein product [Calypogeia fissa]
MSRFWSFYLKKCNDLQEEYADQNTLESRLQTVAKRMTSGNQRAPQHGSQTMLSSLGNMIPTPGSTMIPTPGGNMSVSRVVSGMIPTPGNASTMIPTPGAVGNMIPTPGGISSMMPTPRQSNSMLPSMNNTMSSSGKVNNMMAPSGNGSMMMAPGPSMNSMFAGSGNMIPTPGSSAKAKMIKLESLVTIIAGKLECSTLDILTILDQMLEGASKEKVALMEAEMARDKQHIADLEEELVSTKMKVAFRE